MISLHSLKGQITRATNLRLIYQYYANILGTRGMRISRFLSLQ